ANAKPIARINRPTHQINQWRQVVDNAEDRLQLALTRLANQQDRKLAQLESRLLQTSPIERAKRMDQQLQYAVERLQRATTSVIEQQDNRFERLLDKLDALSPLAVMRRGYTLAYTDKKRKLVRSLNDIQPGDPLQVRLQDGWLDCQVWGMEEEKTNG
ncbi:MAG: exodeoxyribonuclease VII large subunit, partial [Tumebacillaceae bacterium]